MTMPLYKFKREKMTDLQEVTDMIRRADAAWVKCFIAVLYLLGIRAGEALLLTKADFVFLPDKIKVEVRMLKQREKGPYGTPSHVLDIPPNAPFVNDIIIPYVESLKHPLDRLFPYSRIACWKRLKQLNKKISAHVFRHDRATRLAREDLDFLTLQEWFGWKSLDTAKHYLHGGEVDLSKVSKYIR